jgi:hypothetical protein
MTQARDPKLLKNHGQEINVEESWKRNLQKRNHSEGIIEEESWGGNQMKIEYYQFVIHGTHEIFQRVSKESESMVPK